METIVTIKGHRVIDIYESFDGSYWFVTEEAWKQDSVINGTVHENDQILFGYARLSACPQFAEFGYFSEAELKSLGNRIWKVPQKNWAVCPEVEVRQTHERRGNHGARGGREAGGDADAARLGKAVLGLHRHATTCRDGGLWDGWPRSGNRMSKKPARSTLPRHCSVRAFLPEVKEVADFPSARKSQQSLLANTLVWLERWIVRVHLGTQEDRRADSATA